MKRRDWLVNLRKELGYTQEIVAKRAGIERSTYTKAENGCSVSVPTAKAISRVFGCNWVLFFEDDCDNKGQNKTA